MIDEVHSRRGEEKRELIGLGAEESIAELSRKEGVALITIQPDRQVPGGSR